MTTYYNTYKTKYLIWYINLKKNNYINLTKIN